MNIIETGFDGLILIKPRVFIDERGLFYECWRSLEYKNMGIRENFLQANISYSKKNVLRGLHYQVDQGQLVTIMYGKIFDVAVDLRPFSKTYKKYFSIVFDAQNPQQLYMPPGFAHGFCVLSEVALIHYNCTQYYNTTQEGGIIWNDGELDIAWPSNISFIISARDKGFLSIKAWEAKKNG